MTIDIGRMNIGMYLSGQKRKKYGTKQKVVFNFIYFVIEGES